MKRVLFLRLSYFLWVPIAAGLYGGYAAFGLPHVIWSYRFVLAGAGDRWDFSARRYTHCIYIGPAGPFMRDASHGRCPWFAFRRAESAGADQ